MKKLGYVICGLFFLALSTQAKAVLLSLEPSSQTVNASSTVAVDLVISGLGNFAPDSLGDFDINIAFDDSALSFQGYSLGSHLGDLGLAQAIDFSNGDLGGGLVNVSEVSLLPVVDLDLLQPDSFTLASFSFLVDGLAPGGSTIISIDDVLALGDGFGNPLSVDGTSDAIIQVAVAASEPPVALLLVAGLIGYAMRRKAC